MTQTFCFTWIIRVLSLAFGEMTLYPLLIMTPMGAFMIDTIGLIISIASKLIMDYEKSLM